MKRAALFLAPALLLVGCAAAEPVEVDPFDSAWEICTTAYSKLPGSLETLAAQTGETVSNETPCNNWIKSSGRDDFAEFWTDPDEYIPYVISEGKLEALSDLG